MNLLTIKTVSEPDGYITISLLIKNSKLADNWGAYVRLDPLSMYTQLDTAIQTREAIKRLYNMLDESIKEGKFGDE